MNPSQPVQWGLSARTRFGVSPTRRPGRVLRFPAALLGACFAAASARADVGPPVEVRLVRELTGPAVPGQEYTGAFDVLVGASGTLDSIAVHGDGWVGLEVDAADSIRARGGDVLRFNFAGTPGVATGQVRLTFNFNDFPVVRSFDLSPERFARLGKPGGIVSLDDAGRIVPFHPKLSGAGNTAGTQQIHFHGRLAYQRPTSSDDPTLMTVGADNMHFEIKDSDPPPSDDTIYSGFTDPYGYIDVTVNWNDCDITGCDRPDIYIVFEALDDVVGVFYPDFLGPLPYQWSTESSTIDDFTGSDFDFGTLTFDPSQHPAMHIHNSIVRAHRYIQVHDGTDVKRVDVLWPETEGGSGAYYSNEFQMIHISPSRQWGEDTHTHEYGHHFLRNYSAYATPDYANGVCDSGSPGHCMWCSEGGANNDNLQNAWTEGWPNWLADIVTRSYPIDYHDDLNHPYQPYGTRDQENISRYCYGCDCLQDQQFNDPFKTEGYVGALLRDIDDYTQDDHDNEYYGNAFRADYDNDGTNECGTDPPPVEPPPCDCFLDTLGLGWDPIFQIVKLDKPTTIVEFINAFRNRYPRYEQDFYATVMNVSKQYMSVFPEPQPIILSQPEGCQTFVAPGPISLTVQGNGSLLRYQWRKNFVPLAELGNAEGTNKPTLTLNPSSPADGGIYDCVITTCDRTLSTNSVPFRVSVYHARGSGTKGGAWGAGVQGQLGRPIAYISPYPDPIPGLTQAASIAQGPTALHALALNADGSVWSWGDNTYRQLGYVPQFSPSPPQQVPHIHDTVGVAVGGAFSMSLDSDGNVWTWGGNQHGERGPNAPIYGAEPNMLADLDCIVSIAAGGAHGAAVRSDGAVLTWGSNNKGQLGSLTADPDYSDDPTQVPGITDAIAVAAGWYHTLVLRSNGTVMAFGYNQYGQLGDGTTGNSRTTPMPVSGLTNVAMVRAGQMNSFAILQDGTVRGWGSDEGQLGSGSSIFGGRSTPVPAVDVGPVLDLESGASHTLFLRTDHTVWISGSNQFGQLGPPPLLGTARPLKVIGIANAIAVGAAWNTSYVLTEGIAPQLDPEVVSRVIVAGRPTTFFVTAYGTPPFSYQWTHLGHPVVDGPGIRDATTSTLVLDPVVGGEEGEYRVVVTNAFGDATSLAGYLTVLCARGDVDCNGMIDPADAEGFASCIGGPGINLRPAGCIAVDFTGLDMDRDGDVDLGDFALFMQCYSGPNQPIAPACANP